MSRWQLDRLEIFERDEWICQNCGKPINLGIPQVAHRISKGNVKFYGKAIIHHPLNLVSVCCNEPCNSAFNIDKRPEEVRELIKRIEEDLK